MCNAVHSVIKKVMLSQLGEVGVAQHSKHILTADGALESASAHKLGPAAAPIAPPATTVCTHNTLWKQVEKLELHLDPQRAVHHQCHLAQAARPPNHLQHSTRCKSTSGSLSGSNLLVM